VLVVVCCCAQEARSMLLNIPINPTKCFFTISLSC
jgi:hypothetical protein